MYVRLWLDILVLYEWLCSKALVTHTRAHTRKHTDPLIWQLHHMYFTCIAISVAIL